MKRLAKTLIASVSVAGLAMGILTGLSCGKQDPANVDPAERAANGEYTPVDGVAAYGTQCPYGSVGGVKPLRMQLWSCPINAKPVELTQPVTPLYLQADCKDRTLTVRTQDHKIDTSWYFLANGEFDVIIDGLSAKLANDGGGRTNCNAPLAINLFGKITCGPEGANRDKATIKFQSVMWAGKRLNGRGTSPIVQPSPTPGGATLPPPPVAEIVPVVNRCELPESCYFFTQSELKQCS